MVISLAKKKTKLRKQDVKELSFLGSILDKLLYRVPATIFLLILVFLWSGTTTFITGNIFHICISSRKLNNLYCLSAGTNPNFQIPFPAVNGSSVNDHDPITDDTQEYPSVVLENSTSLAIRELPSAALDNNTNFSVNNNLTEEERKAEFEYAVKVVKEQLQVQRSWAANSKEVTNCDGRGVYVYELPPKFNKDLLGQCDMFPWPNFCKYFGNDALGEPLTSLGKGWYKTHQYSLEPIFHSRILKHPCRVYNENDAKLYYVPFYGGLDILRWHFKNVSVDVKDSLALDLISWLQLQQPWGLNSGKDHIFVLGKISWDFRRKSYSQWGSRMLDLDQMQNPIKLLIERQPWHVNDIGVPHPTNFHPHSDEDIVQWQLKIIQSSRKRLVGFAGGARPESPDSIRSALISQCSSTYVEKCTFLNCSSGECDQPESITNLFLESEFCLQPPGDSPTRRSVFDSLISGCIPVLFDPFTAYYQYSWHLPEDHEKYSVFIDKEDVRNSKVDVVDRLMKVPKSIRDDMRRYIVYELMPGLVYGDPNSEFEKFQDAFSLTMNNLLERVTRLE